MEEKEIVRKLAHKEQLLNCIKEDKENLYNRLHQLESDTKPFLKTTRKARCEILMIHKLIRELEQEEDNIIQIWVQFYLLEDNLFEIIQRLYIFKQKWIQVEKEMHISHSVLLRERKKAINIILSAVSYTPKIESVNIRCTGMG